MVHIVTSASAKDEMIKSLRDIGVMHLAEKQSADREVSDRFQTLSKTYFSRCSQILLVVVSCVVILKFSR